MGFVKNAKAGIAAEEARKAAESGQSVFAFVLNSPATRHEFSGEIGDWSLTVAEIEAQGWTLAHWAVGQDSKGRPQAYPLFRRAA